MLIKRGAGALDRLLTPQARGQTVACYIQPAGRGTEREKREEAKSHHSQARLINASPVDMFSAVSS